MKHFRPCFVHGLCIHLNIRNQTDSILRSPEKIIFTKFIFFFSWRNYFGENFRLFDFVRVSCMVRVSVKNLKTLKTSEDLPRQSLQPCFGLIVCMSVMSLKTLKTFINCIILWYRNKKIHFCSSGSSVDTRRYTTINQCTTEGVLLGLQRSSGVAFGNSDVKYEPKHS